MESLSHSRRKRINSSEDGNSISESSNKYPEQSYYAPLTELSFMPSHCSRLDIEPSQENMSDWSEENKELAFILLFWLFIE